MLTIHTSSGNTYVVHPGTLNAIDGRRGQQVRVTAVFSLPGGSTVMIIDDRGREKPTSPLVHEGQIEALKRALAAQKVRAQLAEQGLLESQPA